MEVVELFYVFDNYISLRLVTNRAVANGPVGPAMAGPIIEPVI